MDLFSLSTASTCNKGSNCAKKILMIIPSTRVHKGFKGHTLNSSNGSLTKEHEIKATSLGAKLLPILFQALSVTQAIEVPRSTRPRSQSIVTINGAYRGTCTNIYGNMPVLR